MKKFFMVLMCLFLLVPMSALANESDTHFFDQAGLVEVWEAEVVEEKLEELSEAYRVDFVVATVDTVGSDTVDGYVEYFYDFHNRGYGERRDGVLLLVAMQEREYRILSNGMAADAISASDIEDIGEEIAPYLSDGHYVAAFDEFAELSAKQVDYEINGVPFPFAKMAGISLLIGAVTSLISTGVMKSKLKSVHGKSNATEYTKQGSMQVTHSNDLFLYRNVTRQRRPQQTSGTRSSGGGSRNVGGGKF